LADVDRELCDMEGGAFWPIIIDPQYSDCTIMLWPGGWQPEVVGLPKA
jgi:hypothetical protein